MRLAIWETPHEIARVLGSAVYTGLLQSPWAALLPYHEDGTTNILEEYDAHIGYGILRGMDKVFRACDEKSKPWFNIDRGYFKPGHYDGYYRISLRGTQQVNALENIEPDYERMEKLGIEFFEPYRPRADAHTLYIPPTDHVRDFFGIAHWEAPKFDAPYIVRGKGDATPLSEHLTNCLRVVTFNSSIGWEALRKGIPVYSDPHHSIVGAYQKLIDRPLHIDLKARRDLFAIMSALQMTLDEIRTDKICRILEKLLSLSTSLSGGIPEKPLPAT